MYATTGKARLQRPSPCCYSKFPMSRRKTKLDAAVERTADILLEHFATLPPKEAEVMRDDIARLASASRPSPRGKASRSRKNADPRPLSRVAQNLHKLPLVAILVDLSQLPKKSVPSDLECLNLSGIDRLVDAVRAILSQASIAFLPNLAGLRCPINPKPSAPPPWFSAIPFAHSPPRSASSNPC
jgi:hypothetical protein